MRKQRVIYFLVLFTLIVSLRSSAQNFAKYGQIALMRGNFREAIQYLEKAEAAAPDDINVLWMLGYSYYSDNIFDKAVQSFDKLVQLAPIEIKAFYQRGKCRQKLFQNSSNLSDLQKELFLQDIIYDFSQAISLSRFAYVEALQNRGVAYRDYALLKKKNIRNAQDKKTIFDLFKKSNEDFKIILSLRPMRKDISDLLQLNNNDLRSMR